MASTKIPISAYILDVYSVDTKKLMGASGWTQPQITQAFADANRIWKQADIEFSPIDISKRDIHVRETDKEMWWDFINGLSPKRGIGAGFVYDFPSGNEGGCGGGRIAVVGRKKVAGARDGFAGGLLAHELGHALIDHNHSPERHNLMFESRSPMAVTKDVLDGEQLSKSKVRALEILARP